MTNNHCRSLLSGCGSAGPPAGDVRSFGHDQRTVLINPDRDDVGRNSDRNHSKAGRASSLTIAKVRSLIDRLISEVEGGESLLPALPHLDVRDVSPDPGSAVFDNPVSDDSKPVRRVLICR